MGSGWPGARNHQEATGITEARTEAWPQAVGGCTQDLFSCGMGGTNEDMPVGKKGLLPWHVTRGHRVKHWGGSGGEGHEGKVLYCGYVRDSAAHAENWQSMGSCMGSFMGLGPRGFPLPRVRPRHD